MGWTPEQFRNYEAKRTPQPPKSGNITDESELHRDILAYSVQKGFLVFHGSMAHRTYRTPGEPDFQIYADRGRVFLVEAKTRTGKLSTEQLGVKAWAERLGHHVHVVRSLEEFINLTK